MRRTPSGIQALGVRRHVKLDSELCGLSTPNNGVRRQGDGSSQQSLTSSTLLLAGIDLAGKPAIQPLDRVEREVGVWIAPWRLNHGLCVLVDSCARHRASLPASDLPLSILPPQPPGRQTLRHQIRHRAVRRHSHSNPTRADLESECTSSAYLGSSSVRSSCPSCAGCLGPGPSHGSRASCLLVPSPR